MKNKLAKRFLIILIMLMCIGLLGKPLEAFAASSESKERFDVKVSCGMDGYGKYNRYLPVNFEISNHGEDFSGSIEVLFRGSYMTENVAYSKTFTAAAKETRNVTLALPYMDAVVEFIVSITDEQGRSVYEKQIRTQVIYSDDVYAGVLTDDFNGINYLDGMPFYIDNFDSYVSTRMFALDALSLPDSANALSVLDIIIINNFDTSTLSEAQYEALKVWVAGGGVLMIGTGANYSKTLSLFDDAYLAGNVGALKEETTDFGLENAVVYDRNVPIFYEDEVIEQNEYDNSAEEETVAETKALEEADAVLTSDDSNFYSHILFGVEPVSVDTAELNLNDGQYYPQFLCHAVNKGQGQVLVFSFDLAMEPFVSWDYQMNAIQNILIQLTDVYMSNFRASDMPDYYAVLDMLTNFISDNLPQVSRYVIIIAIYVILISPLLYFVLKRLDKRQYLWVIVPVLALTFTGIVFLFGNSVRQKQPYVNYSTILNTDHGQSVEKTFFSVTSPQNKKYSFSLNDEYKISPPIAPGYYYSVATASEPLKLDQEVVKINDYAGLTVVDVNNVRAFDSKYFVAERESRMTNGLTLNIYYEDDHYAGEVTNISDYILEDVFIYVENKILLIGDLEPGETYTLDAQTQMLGSVDYYNLADEIYVHQDTDDDTTTARRKILQGYAYNFMSGIYSYPSLKGPCCAAGFVVDYPVELLDTSSEVMEIDTEIEGHIMFTQNFELNYVRDGQVVIPDLLAHGRILSGDIDANDHMFYSDEAEIDITLPADIKSLDQLQLGSRDMFGDSNEPILYYLYNWNTGVYDEIFTDSETETDLNMDDYLWGRDLRIKTKKEYTGSYNTIYIPAIRLTGREDYAGN